MGEDVVEDCAPPLRASRRARSTQAAAELYVVAVARSALPAGPFVVQLTAADPPREAPEERTVVAVDLRTPGSTATDSQIGFDPDLVEEPHLVDIVRRGQTVEVGFAFTYSLRPDCTLKIVGPINGTVWASENDFGLGDKYSDDPDDWFASWPDEWAAQLTSPNDHLIVEGIIHPDGATLTFTANDHTERFEPAPPDTHSDCT